MGTNEESDEDVGSKNVRWGSTPKSKKFTNVKKWGAHFGLFLALVIYTALGAWAFQRLEKETELKVLNSRKDKLRDAKRNFTSRVNDSTSDPESFYLTFNAALKDYEDVIMEVADGELDRFMIPNSTIETSWSYVRSAFFASTVLTTIGYGDMAPETFAGRVFCCIFAFIGIPFTLTVIADLGKMMASIVSHVYKRCKKQFQKKGGTSTASKFKKSATVGALLGFLLFYIAVGGVIFSYWEKWEFFNSFYFCFITMTTIGFGDLVPVDTEIMLYCTIYILVGLALTSTAIELVRSQYADSWRKMRELSARLQGLSGLSDALRNSTIILDLSGWIVLHFMWNPNEQDLAEFNHPDKLHKVRDAHRLYVSPFTFWAGVQFLFGYTRKYYFETKWSILKTIFGYGDNINLDVSVLNDLKELKKALGQGSGKRKREGSIWNKFWENEDGFEPNEAGEPRLIQIIIYESSV